jgi:hypothetical protein
MRDKTINLLLKIRRTTINIKGGVEGEGVIGVV